MSTEDDANDDEDRARWAADEPTAMWDESMMRDAGFDELAQHREVQPRSETGPATGREVGGDVKAKVGVSAELTGGHRAVPAPEPSKGNGLSWIVTGLLAVLFGVAAYFAVRFLR